MLAALQFGSAADESAPRDSSDNHQADRRNDRLTEARGPSGGTGLPGPWAEATVVTEVSAPQDHLQD